MPFEQGRYSRGSPYWSNRDWLENMTKIEMYRSRAMLDQRGVAQEVKLPPSFEKFECTNYCGVLLKVWLVNVTGGSPRDPCEFPFWAMLWVRLIHSLEAWKK